MVHLPRKVLLCLVLFLILAVAPVLAENRIGAFSVTPMAGFHLIDGALMLDNGPALGIAAGYNIDAHWTIEGDVRVTPTETDGDDPVDVNVWALSLGAFYHFQPEQALNPYLGLGGGGLVYDIDDARHDDEDYMGFWGGGVKYALNDYTALRLDLRHLLNVQTDKEFTGEDDDKIRHHLQAMVGISFQFGGTSNRPVMRDMAAMLPAETAPAVEPVAPMAAAADPDADHDGVLDPLDQCAGTAAGVRVDATGCPADTDGDGVADFRDACVDTPANVEVDQQGCPVVEEPVIDTLTLSLRFGVDRSGVTPFHYRELDRAAEFIDRYPQAEIRVVGHTDSQGDAAYNQNLSRQRAENVRAVLVKKYGVDDRRIAAVGMGEAEPVASNQTEAGRQQNRRVEIRIHPE